MFNKYEQVPQMWSARGTFMLCTLTKTKALKDPLFSVSALGSPMRIA